ncbi:MAG: amino acid--tRNA ligase-related protein, partial [Candidatus Firestonebacteria bacterium]
MEIDLIKERAEKLAKIKESGVNPYPYKYDVKDRAKELKEKYSGIAVGEHVENIEVSVAGRLMTIRDHGKSCFANLKDSSGSIQLYIKKDLVGLEQWELFTRFDMGDIAGAKGDIFKTKTGEVTVRVKKIELLAKSMLPLPEKWHGLSDVETRYRQRYLDLISNPEVMNTFHTRSCIIKQMRNFLDTKGFLEVETPMMHSIPGGAAAKPFKTFHNALGIPLYMRIAPELFLKRLLVGGFEKVY